MMKSVLVETPADFLQDQILNNLGDLRDKGLNGVYVSINKPFKAMDEVFRSRGIPTEDMFFVDCISSWTQEYSDKVSFISNISDLGSMSISISRFLDELPGVKFLIIDAVHTLWIYHTPESIANFIQNLAERSYNSKTELIVFIVESEDQRLIQKLAPFFDIFMKANCDKKI